MDPRGIGIWDGGPNELAIWALDNDEAGVEGRVRSSYTLICIALDVSCNLRIHSADRMEDPQLTTTELRMKHYMNK